MGLPKREKEGITEEVSLSPQDALESLYNVLSAWRNKTTEVHTTIQQMKNELPSRLGSLMDTASCSLKKDFIQKLGYHPNDKDVAFIDTLQWAYQGACNNFLSSSHDQTAHQLATKTSLSTPHITQNDPTRRQHASQTTSSPYWICVFFGGGFTLIIAQKVYEEITFKKTSTKAMEKREQEHSKQHNKKN